MRRFLPSASYLELASHCAYPWTGGVRWPARGPAAPSQRYGNAFHGLAAAVVEDLAAGVAPDAAGRVPPLVERFDLVASEAERLAATRANLVELLVEEGVHDARAEVGFGYDLETGLAREIGDRKDKGAAEIYGAADLVLVRRGVLVVRDWKTGARMQGRRPAQVPQLRFLAVAAAMTLGVQRAVVEIGCVDEDGAEIVGEDLDAGELADAELEVQTIAARLDEPPVPVPGPWCEGSYCPIRAICPATRAALARVHQDLDAFPLLGEVTSAEHAAHVRHRLPVLRAALDDAERALKAFAQREPVPVPGQPGVFWGPVEHDGRERIEATPEAVALVRERLGDAGAEEAIERSITKASIERGAKAAIRAAQGGKVPRGAVPAAVGPLLEQLRAAKLLKKGARYVRFEEFKRGAEGQPLELLGPGDEPEDVGTDGEAAPL